MIGLLGFGEAGSAIASGLVEEGVVPVAYDAAADPDHAAAIRDRAATIGVELVDDAAALLARANLILALVTSAVAVQAAQSVAPYLDSRHLYVDLNSARPATKAAVGNIVSATGARFVDGAVMAAIPPHRHRVPILLAGPSAGEVVEALSPLGFRLEKVGDTPGQASAIKLCRSLLVKGVEALVWECVAVADAHGATERVLGGVGDALGGGDWRAVAGYLMSRTLTHGTRRAHELTEVAEIARAAGVDPVVTQAAATRLGRIAQRNREIGQAYGGSPDLEVILAAVREALRP